MRFTQTWMHKVLCDWWVAEAEMMIDEAPRFPNGWQEKLRKVFDVGFPHPYNVAQFLLDHNEARSVHKDIASALENSRAAYRVVDGKIVPYGTEAEYQQLLAAVQASDRAGASGARAHLLQSGQEMMAGNWRKSVHESVSAVESVAKVISGEHGKGLSELIKSLAQNGQIPHPALAAALSKLYAYSSDEKGVRHALVLDGEAKVTESDAFLILGICAAFVSYLLREDALHDPS